MIRLVFSILISLSLITANVNAGVFINEVMVNEPSGFVTLEWFELYNDMHRTVSLDNYQIHIGSKVIEFETGIELEAGAYQVFCRQLFTYGTTRGFEEFWGDNSKVWGDTYQESLISTPIEISESFSFINASGIIKLYDNNELLISEFEWISSGLDGYSSNLSDIIEQSIDKNGASPGYVNSITPVPNDLAVELLDVNKANGLTNISLLVTNVGTNTVSNAILSVNEFVSDILISPLDSIDLPALVPQETYSFNKGYDNLFIYYTTLEVVLSDDDRQNNNEIIFVAPGSDFPPVILTEILANPISALNSEWVEIYNRSFIELDINGWLIGDSLNTETISSMSYILQPGEYLILAENSENFNDYYTNFTGDVIEPLQWASFNNSSDEVRLIDQYGLELDCFSYNKVHANNQTWARGSEIQHQNEWGYSEIPDGTPGEENYNIYFSPSGSDLKLTLDPKIISPDGDGIDEFSTIKVEAPSDNDYKLKIYDRQGREVFSFDRVRDENQWHGVNNGGGRLPIGIYIVYLEVVGGESTKQPIVIAR